MNKKREFGVNIGTSSILLIFVILCLVSFASLSIVSATADQKLTTKVSDRTISYYEACNKAEEKLAQIDSYLSETYADGLTKDAYFQKVGNQLSYAIPISDLQTLEVHLSLLYPTKNNPYFYEISSWQVVTTGTLEYDETLPVFK